MLAKRRYVILILDGAAGWPLDELGGATALAAARTPNLDALARSGRVGLARTVPEGMEPSSAAACVSIMGFDPRRYPMGRGAIEAASMRIELGPHDVAFRCNLVTVLDGLMRNHSAGHIPNGDSHRLLASLQRELGSGDVQFFPGVSYRHIVRLTSKPETLHAICTPPHDIIGMDVDPYLPQGRGSEVLLDLMERSKAVLADDPVTRERAARGEPPATMIWLFWGGAKPTAVPSFNDVYGLRAAITSAVHLIGGLAHIFGLARLDIEGVTDGADNNYAAQAEGALSALSTYDIVIIHVEAPDEAGHAGDLAAKIAAIEAIDQDMLPVLTGSSGDLRILAMPDHPTPIALRTHAGEPVPFVLAGSGVQANGATAFHEKAAAATGLLVDGWQLMRELID